TPQSIRVADLSANGPGDNSYVTLTDFKFRTSDVHVSVWKGNQSKLAGTAYFPLDAVKKGKKQSSEKKTPRVVVVAPADTPEKVKAFLTRGSITGLVKGSTYESLETKKEPVEWRVDGRTPEMVWFVWADEKPEKADPERIEKVGYGMGVA